MSHGFVSTSVLESKDGIDYSVEKRKENEETRLAAVRSAKAEAKPLYVQLAEQQQKKQEEYEAMSKLIFAPPRALEDEDVQYFEELQRRKADINAKLTQQEETELAAFHAERLASSVVSSELTSLPPPKTHRHPPSEGQKKKNHTPPIVVKHKRKDTKANEAPPNPKKLKNENPPSDPTPLPSEPTPPPSSHVTRGLRRRIRRRFRVNRYYNAYNIKHKTQKDYFKRETLQKENKLIWEGG